MDWTHPWHHPETSLAEDPPTEHQKGGREPPNGWQGTMTAGPGVQQGWAAAQQVLFATWVTPGRFLTSLSLGFFACKLQP